MNGSSSSNERPPEPPTPPPRPPSSKPPAREVVLRGAKGVAESARNAGLIGAAMGATSEAVASLKPLIRGDIDGVRYVGRVLSSASSAGSDTVARAAAALALRATVMSVARRLGAETLHRAVGSAPGAAVAFGSVNQAIHTSHLARKRIDRREYGQRTSENVGATGGGLGGAAVGAAVGSLLPGPGTAIGAILGGIAGGIAGGRTGRAVGEKIAGQARDAAGEAPVEAD